MNSSSGSIEEVTFITLNSVSVLVCLLATILVFALRLHKKIVYRLALYQVISALLLATMNILATIVAINYYTDNRHARLYGSLCSAIGWFIMFFQWMKLLFTMWITLHLVCFAVSYKDLKKLEVLYVVTSLLVPAVVACVPLTTGTYSPRGNCNIGSVDPNVSASVIIIEYIVLWDGPALLVLLAASTAMLIMVAKLSYRVCWRAKYEQITHGDRFWMVLKQLLPLAAFPIIFFIFIIPMLVFNILVGNNPRAPNAAALRLAIIVSTPMWSMLSGVVLLIHISVVHRCRPRCPFKGKWRPASTKFGIVTMRDLNT